MNGTSSTSSGKRVLQLPCNKIRTDGGTQARAAICDEAVEEFADVLRSGDELPSVIAFFDGRHYWLADGFHRLAAHVLAGHRVIYSEVYDGTRRDAVLYACGANGRRGVRVTSADKRRAVSILLADGEWSLWSNREIARRACATEFLVRTIREELTAIKSQVSEWAKAAAQNGPVSKPMPSREVIRGPAGHRPEPGDGGARVQDARACLEQARESLAELGDSSRRAVAAVDVALAEVAALT